MNQLLNKLCSRLFTVAAALSLVLLISTLVGWYLGFDSPVLWRVGQVELTFQSPALTLHVVSRAEETDRQQVENRAIIGRDFESRRSVIDHEISAQPWGSDPYKAALDRYNLWYNAHKTYQSTVPPNRIWAANDRTGSLARICGTLLAIPLIWLFPWWRRSGDRVKQRLRRRLKWAPRERLTLLQRGRRAFFLSASVVSFLLALATALEWVRSHYVSDTYTRLEEIGSPRYQVIKIRRFNTFAGGFSVGYTNIAYWMQFTQMRPAAGPLQSYLSSVGDLLVTQRRGGKTWNRENPRLPPRVIPWYGVAVAHTPQSPVVAGWSCTIRWWPVLILFSLLPTLWLMLYVRCHPLPEGPHCPSCWYNLTGNTSGVCPECGASLLERNMA